MTAGLRKRFGRQKALDGVTINLTPGAIGLLGPNGPGRSAFIKCLACCNSSPSLSIPRHLRARMANNATIRALDEWSPDGTLMSVTSLLVATVGLVAEAALLFAHRECHAADEMRKQDRQPNWK